MGYPKIEFVFLYLRREQRFLSKKEVGDDKKVKINQITIWNFANYQAICRPIFMKIVLLVS
jgi:hypothetical protein